MSGSVRRPGLPDVATRKEAGTATDDDEAVEAAWRTKAQTALQDTMGQIGCSAVRSSRSQRTTPFGKGKGEFGRCNEQPSRTTHRSLGTPHVFGGCEGQPQSPPRMQEQWEAGDRWYLTCCTFGCAPGCC